jgi:hypothetical protein
VAGSLEYGSEFSGSTKGGEFVDYQLLSCSVELGSNMYFDLCLVFMLTKVCKIFSMC